MLVPAAPHLNNLANCLFTKAIGLQFWIASREERTKQQNSIANCFFFFHLALLFIVVGTQNIKSTLLTKFNSVEYNVVNNKHNVAQQIPMTPSNCMIKLCTH